MDGLSEFYPDRMAERILDMGDILEIVSKVEDVIDEDEAFLKYFLKVQVF